MTKRITLLIVDDSPQQRETLMHYFDTKSDVEVIGACGNTGDAGQMIMQTNPDALIIDILMPREDGLSLLKRLSSSEFNRMPKTIVMSAAASDDMVQSACSFGVKYYLIKPCDNDLLYRRLKDMFCNEENERRNEQTESWAKTPEEKIAKLFLSIGIAPHIKGYRYLRQAIMMAVEEPALIDGITKKLYPKIAMHYDTTASKVERAIRHAIDVAWSRGKIENINKFIGYDIYTSKDKPTNGEFIALIVDMILLEHGAA